MHTRSGAEAVTVVAVDFGATSIRVCRVVLGDGPPQLDVVHRHHHQPRADPDGVVRWDWPQLVSEMEAGLTKACGSGPVASIGVDTWGVDYGLLDGRGELVAPPVSYRDRRTDGYLRLVDRIGADRLFSITGLQLQPINTIFQVAAHDRDELARASHLLMLPELLVHHLTGEITAERTSTGTSGLVDITSGEWSAPLLDEVGLAPALLAPIAPAGTPVGRWQGIPVHLVGGHDTASAVVAMGAGADGGTAFVSAGTWFLVGRERPSPDLSARARSLNFANELGAAGGVRLLKNLAGGWLVEGCRAAWGDPPVEALLDAASRQPAGPVVDVQDPRFLHPDDMLAEITAAAGLRPDAEPGVVLRCVIDSLAAGTATVIGELGELDRTARVDAAEVGDDPRRIDALQLFGGASRWPLLIDRLTEVTGLPVHRGPVEATALGNALVQGMALGVYDDLAAARGSLTPPAP